MTEALATQGPGGLARPDFIKAGARGTENIQQADIKFPALRLAQAMSPECKRSEPSFIEGLREGDLFNSVTRENYGENTVNFLIINQLGHRNIEFDATDRNVVLDGNVPDDDERCQFTVEMVDGKEVRRKPKATKFYDYLILLCLPNRNPQVMTLSLKSTQLKKAIQLNSIIKESGLDSFALLFKGTPVPEKKGNNAWYGWRFDVAGWPSADQYRKAEEIYVGLKGKAVEVEVEKVEDVATAQTDDDIPF